MNEFYHDWFYDYNPESDLLSLDAYMFDRW